MTGWRLLLSVSVSHDFYAPAGAPGLSLAPVTATARWLRRAGCLFQSGDGSLRVLQSGAPLPPPDDEIAGGLLFHGFAADPLFHNVTDALPTDVRRMPLFAPAAAGSDPWPLRREGDVARGLSGAPHQGPVPCLAIRLPVPRADGQTDGRAVAYRLELASRSTVWKYLLVGDWRIDRLEVVDLAGEVAFDGPQPESLADGSAALAIRSRQSIALRQRADHRFQLRGRRASASRAQQQILVKRLPLADARHFALESAASPPALVSEILVHR